MAGSFAVTDSGHDLMALQALQAVGQNVGRDALGRCDKILEPALAQDQVANQLFVPFKM